MKISVTPIKKIEVVDDANEKSFISFILNIKDNFLSKPIYLIEGLSFNHCNTLKKIHFNLNSTFISGEKDIDGNVKFFHSLSASRISDTEKNINFDEKDMRVLAKTQGAYWKSWIMRMDLREWMTQNGFSHVLNESKLLFAQFASVVWYKHTEYQGSKKKIKIEVVDLRNLVFDPSVKALKDSQIVLKRSVMSVSELLAKKKDGWNERKIDKLISSFGGGTAKSDSPLDSSPFTLSSDILMFNVWEGYGEIPARFLPDVDLKNTTQYRKFIIVNLDDRSGGAELVYSNPFKKDFFPFKEAHGHRVPGRWLAFGVVEVLFPLQVRVNELINRFFSIVRLGATQLFQTRSTTIRQNFNQDVRTGDVVSSPAPISPIATEMRAFPQYEAEFQNINAAADKMTNISAVVSGDSLPAATPFRLSAQLGVNAAKYFNELKQSLGLLASEALMEWIIPELEESLTEEHTLELLGSTEELAAFEKVYRSSILFDQMKKFILKHTALPSKQDFDTAEQILTDQIKSGDKKIFIKRGFFSSKDIKNVAVYIDPTGEQQDTVAIDRTLETILQLLASNPTIKEDPDIRMIMGMLMENGGVSPLKLSSFLSGPPTQGAPPAPVSPGTPTAQGANGPRAAPPAMANFSSNPGSAKGGLTVNSVGDAIAARAKM